MPTRFHSYVLYSHLPALKCLAKSIKKAQGITHYAALNQVARQYGYKAWSHLAAEADKALDAWADIPNEIYESSVFTPLSELIETNRQAADIAIDELAKDLYLGLQDAMKDDETYLRSSVDFGDLGSPLDGEVSINGWRLYADKPGGWIERRAWCERGMLLAYIDSSVGQDWLMDICQSEFAYDEDSMGFSDEQLENGIIIGRLLTRMDQAIHFHNGGVISSESPLDLIDSCRSAICCALEYSPDE